MGKHAAVTDDLHRDEIGLGDFLRLVWRGRWLVAGCLAGGLLMAALYLASAHPLYRVEAMLQVESRRPGQGPNALSTLTDGVFTVSTEAQAEVEILKSNLVLGRTVESQGLDLVVAPVRLPVIGGVWARMRGAQARCGLDLFEVPSGLRGRPFKLRATGNGAFELLGSDGQMVARGMVGEEVRGTSLGQPVRLKVRDLAASAGQVFQVVRKPMLAAIKDLRDDLKVEEKGKQTNIIGLQLEAGDPIRGAETLNAVLAHYIRQNIERKAEEASRTLVFLQEQLPLLKGQLEVTEERLNAYRAGTGAVDLSEEARMVLRQSADLEAQVVALKQRRQELLRTHLEKSDMVQGLEAQIERLQSESGRLDHVVRKLPRTQQEVLRMTRDAQVNQELYTQMLNNVQHLQVAKAGEIGNARIVDHASPGLLPVSPRPQMAILLAVVLGLGVGVGLVLVRKALNRAVEDPQVLEAAFGLPVLATVPHSRHQDRLRRRRSGEVLAQVAPEDMAVESLRSLRTSLHFSLVDVPRRVVVLTGPAPEIGKSFLAVNLATVLAQAGARVLLVDADMRKGHLHRMVGEGGRQPGLSEILSGQAGWEEAVRTVGGVAFIPSGTLPPNPAELLMGSRLESFLEAVAGAYDLVLMDTPPVLAVTDAMILGARAGATLLVLKAGRHPVEEVRLTLQRLSHAGIRPKGFVFNDLPRQGEAAAYADYTYRYVLDGTGDLARD